MIMHFFYVHFSKYIVKTIEKDLFFYEETKKLHQKF